MSDSIVIFATGQSNMATRRALTWTPPSNLRLWNFNASVHPSTYAASEYIVPAPNIISTGLSFATEVARNNRGRSVYLVDISKSSMEIANWGPNPPDYNFRQAINRNLPLALAVAGAESPDVMLWWQGGSDIHLDRPDYGLNFQKTHTWFTSQTYFRQETPILMFGSSPHNTPEIKNGAGNITACVADDPHRRMFVHVGLLQIQYWQSDSTAFADRIHMTGPGYQAAGRLAYDTWAHGIGSKMLANKPIDFYSQRLVSPCGQVDFEIVGNLLAIRVHCEDGVLRKATLPLA